MAVSAAFGSQRATAGFGKGVNQDSDPEMVLLGEAVEEVCETEGVRGVQGRGVENANPEL